MSYEGVLHLATVDFLDITNIEEQYSKGAFETWKRASPLRRARSGLSLFSARNGGLIAYGGWPFTDKSITIEENVNIMNGGEWIVVDKKRFVR